MATTIAPPPNWLVEGLQTIKPQAIQKTPPLTHGDGTPYGLKAFEGILQEMRDATEGIRNDTYNRLMFRTGQLVAGGELAAHAVEQLKDAARHVGLTPHEIEQTFRSGFEKGRENPSSAPAAHGDRRDSAHANRYDTTDSTSEEPEESRILPPPPSVPLEAFPPVARDLMEEATAAFCVPMQIVVTCFLAFLACLVGRSRLISIKAGWEEACNLWLAVVALSGMGKSPVMAAFFSVITRLEYDAKKTFDNAYAAYETELVLYQVQRNLQAKDKAKGKEIDAIALVKPVEPKQRQATVDDVTIEALGDIHQVNPKGVGLLKDELSGLFFDMDRYTPNSGGGTKARLLSAHSLGSWKTNRSSNPSRNNFIPKACVSIFGGIQPGMMSKVFEAGAGGIDEESGLLPRFIFIRAAADGPAYWTECIFTQDSKNLLTRIAAALWQWDIAYDADGREIEKIVPVSSQAKKLYVQWYNSIAEEAFLAQNSALLRKLQAHALRLCLLLHCLDAALSGTDGMSLVSADTMRRALLLADWVKEHQAQCWRFFTPEKGAKQANPIEQAIMQVVVEEAAKIEADGWQISNERLFSLVEKQLGMPGLSDVKLGRAASALGLASCVVGRGRGRTITPEKIKGFKATVVSVVSVETPYTARETSCDRSQSHLSYLLQTTDSAMGTCDRYNSTATDSSGSENLTTQGLATDTTDTTDSSVHNSVFDADRVEI